MLNSSLYVLKSTDMQSYVLLVRPVRFSRENWGENPQQTTCPRPEAFEGQVQASSISQTPGIAHDLKKPSCIMTGQFGKNM